MIAVIIPTLDEEQYIARAIASARAPAASEIIVADGGSTDRTRTLAADAATVVSAPRGRAAQMNAGARVARAPILLFLHADTLLPPGYDRAVLEALADPHVVGGRFDISLEPSSPLLWLTSVLISRRSRLTRIATGDQAIFVRREVFDEIGGFPPIPLMEDVTFSARLKRRGKIACRREKVISSSRRWRKHGVVRTILLMWSLRLLYFFGVSAERLHRLYADAR